MTADIEYTYRDKTEIAKTLIGHKVIKVSGDTLELDDGRALRFEGNVGGCVCGAGDYDLTDLNEVDNIITNVEFVDNPDSDYSHGAGIYQIFVFAENKKINLATFTGSDGNGYYGTGYSIYVR